MSEAYTPYGPEWTREVMKRPKVAIVASLETACRERDAARANVKPMGEVTICRNGYLQDLEQYRERIGELMRLLAGLDGSLTWLESNVHGAESDLVAHMRQQIRDVSENADIPRVCPKCGSTDSEKIYYYGSAALPGCDFLQCDACNHQWDHD